MAGKTTRYYQSHPLAKAKKDAYQKEFNKRPGESEHRAECNAGRKKLGLKKGDKRDASHTKSGDMVAENRVTNRARNGANNKSTKK